MQTSPLTYGLTHVAIKVSNLQATREFYQQIFDMTVMYDEKDFIQMTTPGSSDILVFQKARVPTRKNSGIEHIGFRLKQAADISEITRRLQKAKAEIVDQGEFIAGSPYVFFKDPDGYVIEVWFEKLP